MTAEDNHPESNVSAFTANLTGLLRAVDLCLQEQLVLPTLVLIYSGIDVASSLEAKHGERVQDYFTRWVEHYLLKHLGSDLRAIDIYAARCGIVHNYSGSSNLTREGKARQIAYAWGAATLEQFRTAARRLHVKMPALHLSAFAKAYRLALLDWLDDVSSDAARMDVVQARSNSLWFKNLTTKEVAAFNRIPRKGFRTAPKRR